MSRPFSRIRILPAPRGAAAAMVLSVFLLSLAAPTRAGAAPTPPSFADLAERLNPSVVNISSETIIKTNPMSEFFRQFPFPFGLPPGFQPPTQPYEQRRTSLGSGVIIDPSGLILTNNHVIENATQITVNFDNKKKKKKKAKVVGRDPRTDLALLKVELEPGEKFPAATFGDSEKLRVGDWVIAIGNPFGLSHTVTAGIVSAKGRVIGAGPYDDFIQTDASINPGNSGGPLFNLKGEIVGINTAIFSRTGGNIGIGFAIPINVAKELIPQLRAGRVTRGYLGITIQPVTSTVAKNFGLKEVSGALVADIVKDGPAAKAGLKRGDVIVTLDGHKVPTSRSLPRMVARLKPGSISTLGIVRNGKPMDLKIKIGKLPDKTVVAKVEKQKEVTKKLGIKLENLTPEVAQRLGTRASEGALIAGVAPGSPAARAGLRRGDVVIEVNRKSVRNPNEFLASLKKGKKEANILLVDRRGTTLFIELGGQG